MSFHQCRINGIMPYITFWDWLFSVCIIPSRSVKWLSTSVVHSIALVSKSDLFQVNIGSHCSMASVSPVAHGMIAKLLARGLWPLSGSPTSMPSVHCWLALFQSPGFLASIQILSVFLLILPPPNLVFDFTVSSPWNTNKSKHWQGPHCMPGIALTYSGHLFHPPAPLWGRCHYYAAIDMAERFRHLLRVTHRLHSRAGFGSK